MRRSHVTSSKIIVIVSLKNAFCLAYRANLDEMPYSAAFHLGIQCLQKYQLRGFRLANSADLDEMPHSVAFHQVSSLLAKVPVSGFQVKK